MTLVVIRLYINKINGIIESYDSEVGIKTVERVKLGFADNATPSDDNQY